MPKNQRPEGLLGDWRYGWEGTTLNERIQAQNQWDLLAEQEKANELAERNLREQRENAEKIAEATRQAERDRYRNEQLLEQQRLDNQKEMRFYNICDEAGIDYNDIKLFKVWLNNYTLKQNKEQLRKIEKVQRKIYTGELKTLSDENELLKEKIKLKKREKNNNMFLVNNRKIKYTESLAETRIENVEKRIKNSKLVAILIAIAFLIFLIMGIKDKYIIDEFSWIFAIAFMLEWVCIGIIKGSKTQIYNLKEYINKERMLGQEIQELETKDNIQKNRIDELFNERQKELATDDEFMKFYSEVEKINNLLLKGICPNMVDFKAFRMCHYNEEAEKLLRKLELNLGVVDKNDIKATGTFKEYVEFIESKVDELHEGFNTTEDDEVNILNKYKITLDVAKTIVNKLENIGAIKCFKDENLIKVLVTQEQWEILKNRL